MKFRASKPLGKNKVDFLSIQEKAGAKDQDVNRIHKIRWQK